MSKFNSRAEWLASLKVGDVVGYNASFSRIPTEQMVERTTATQIVIGNSRYSKKDGLAIGSYSQWSRPHIVEITDSVREQIELRDLRSWFSTRNWSAPTINQLRAMKKAHDDAAPKKDKAP